MEKIIFFVLFSAFCLLNVFQIALNDAAQPWQIGFQDPATPVMQGLIDLHHDIFSFMVFVLLFVVWMLGRTVYKFNIKKNSKASKNNTWSRYLKRRQ
jgi:heme/copper-type cytochrome/quinol oxidase subunit 2